MSNWDGLNRRRFPRANYPCLVVISRERKDSNERDIILTHTENIGVGGVCVILKQNIERFDSVDLEVDLLDLEDHIKCKGKVVWNIQRKSSEKKKPLFYDIGIEFSDLSPKDKKRLEDIVNRLAKENK